VLAGIVGITWEDQGTLTGLRHVRHLKGSESKSDISDDSLAIHSSSRYKFTSYILTRNTIFGCLHTTTISKTLH
jgi:hypothetical protein